MSEKTKEVPQLEDATYAHTLVIKSIHESKVHGHMVPTFHFLQHRVPGAS